MNNEFPLEYRIKRTANGIYRAELGRYPCYHALGADVKSLKAAKAQIATSEQERTALLKISTDWKNAKLVHSEPATVL